MQFPVRIERDIEPGTLKVFDLHHYHDKDGSNVIRILSLKSDSFFVDTVRYRYGQQITQQTYTSFIETELEDIKLEEVEDTPIKSFSIRWPYVTYSNKKLLIIVNAFDTNTINRVEFLSPNIDHNIVNTFITNTNDLLVLVQTEQEFILYCIDLDKSNIYELTNEDDFEKIFEPFVLYRYKVSDVDHKKST